MSPALKKQSQKGIYSGFQQVHVEGPLILDPLLFSFGLIPSYRFWGKNKFEETPLKIEIRSDQGLFSRSWMIGSIVEGSNLVDLSGVMEHIADNLQRRTGRKYLELSTSRHIDLFLESIKMSNSWSTMYGLAPGSEGSNDLYLHWCMPPAARILGMTGEVNYSKIGDRRTLDRFDSHEGLMIELSRLSGIIDCFENNVAGLHIPPLIRIGKLLESYVEFMR